MAYSPAKPNRPLIMLRRLASTLGFLAALAAPSGDAASSLDPRELDRLPLHVVLPTDVDRVRRSLPEGTERDPTLVALNIPTALDLADGQWSREGTLAVWRLRLYSQQAKLIIPSFSRFELPPGAELRVMDIAGRVIQGPYTQRNRSRDGGLTTALVPGEEALLELRVPEARRGEVRLQLSSIGHGLRGLAAEQAVPKSGSCNIDVVCSQGDGWRDQIRSVVRLQITRLSGTFFCTGQLLNNTSQDDTPYVLTANHCGITSSNDARVVVYYNYYTSICGGTPDGRLTQNQEGSVLVASDASSDHSLIRLEEAPGRAFNVYLAGFNASTTDVPQSGRVIHHPAADEKRISVYTTPAGRTLTSIEGIGTDLAVFGVSFSQGVTEAGSSGSALFNQDQQVVGVLSGGSTSCANPDGQDFFGRLDVAWTHGLSQFLDPGSTGRTMFCGTNPGTDCNPNPGGGGGGNVDDTPSTGSGGGGAFGSAFLLALAAALARLRSLAGPARAVRTRKD